MTTTLQDKMPETEAVERHETARRRLRTALKLIQTFQSEVRDTMPVQVAATFLIVCLNEGKSLKEYMELAGVAQSTMSRHLLDLGDKNRKGEVGYQLIDRMNDPRELRKNMYLLTAKGRKLRDKILEVMAG